MGVQEKKPSALYRLIKWIVKCFYPKIQVVGAEKLPEGAAVIVGNHSQMNGPIACELYTPGKHYVWCAGQMMQLEEVPGYAYHDFWSEKPKWLRPFYKLLSYVIAPLSVCVFNNANTIGVYHDTRILATFKQTVQRLQEGAKIVIFPEYGVQYNHIVCQFQDRFIDVAKLYYKRTGQRLGFVPMYLTPARKEMHYGNPIYFCPENSADAERERICKELMDEITRMAVSLPEHKVVPYKNVPRKQYLSNKSEERINEKTGD